MTIGNFFPLLYYVSLFHLYRFFYHSPLSLNIIPPIDEPLLSDWPAAMDFSVSKPPQQIDPAVTANLKQVGYKTVFLRMLRLNILRFRWAGFCLDQTQVA